MGFEKKVELVGITRHPDDDSWRPDDYVVAPAMGCKSELSSSVIHGKYAVNGEPYGEKELNWNQTQDIIIQGTVGSGHGAVLDMLDFHFSIDNLTRASTLFLCGPEYASHLQQSLRAVSAERGFDSFSEEFGGERGFDFIVPEKNEGNDIMGEQFELYEKMCDAGVITEDARIILPLNTKTAIHSKWDARELAHLKSMSERMDVPSDVRDIVSQMYDLAYKVAPKSMANWGKNFEVLSWFPSSQLFSRGNSVLEGLANEDKGMQLLGYHIGLEMTADEISKAIKNRDEALLSNLKHYHFTFSIPMSLMSFHQATRQRTWNQAVEPLSSAVKRGEYTLPETIKKAGFGKDFVSLFEKSVNYVRENLDNPNIYGVVPHALEVYNVVHINGWNAIHSIGKRTCTHAQWEIRNLARYMAGKIEEVTPELGKYAAPQGITYGVCPEKKPCGLCKTNNG